MSKAKRQQEAGSLPGQSAACLKVPLPARDHPRGRKLGSLARVGSCRRAFSSRARTWASLAASVPVFRRSVSASVDCVRGESRQRLPQEHEHLIHAAEDAVSTARKTSLQLSGSRNAHLAVVDVRNNGEVADAAHRHALDLLQRVERSFSWTLCTTNQQISSSRLPAQAYF